MGPEEEGSEHVAHTVSVCARARVCVCVCVCVCVKESEGIKQSSSQRMRLNQVLCVCWEILVFVTWNKVCVRVRTVPDHTRSYVFPYRGN